MAYFIDRLNNRIVGWVIVNIPDKGTVYFQIVDGQIAQIGLGRQPCAKVIQGKLDTDHLQFFDEFHHGIHASHC